MCQPHVLPYGKSHEGVSTKVICNLYSNVKKISKAQDSLALKLLGICTSNVDCISVV